MKTPRHLIPKRGPRHRRWSRPIDRGLHAVLIATASLLLITLAVDAAEEQATTRTSDPAASTGSPRTVAIPAFRQASHIAILEVKGEIDLVTLRSLERRIERAKNDGAQAIVLDIDTPGGRVDATLDICNLLKSPSETPPNTVAWINPQAYSAGTIIALACREIVVAPNATFGDAAPIQGAPVVGLMQMAPTERAKIEAPILTEVIDSARRNHYDENLVQSFVSVGIELWLIEHVDTGERVFVDRAEYETVIGEPPAANLTSVTPPSATGAGVAPRLNTVAPKADGDAGEYALDEELAEQLAKQVEYQQQLPPTRQPLTAEERGKWRGVAQVISSDRLLTVKKDEAVYYGLAQRVIATDSDLLAFFGAATMKRYNQSWSESLVRVLLSLPMRILLIVIFLICLFVEMAAPGTGVFGATALVALLLLVGAPFLIGMAQWWDILLIAVGLVLLAAEVLVIPGLGIAGFAGALCLLAGLVGTFISGDVASPEGRDELWTGLVSTLSAVFAAGVGMWLISRHIGTLPIVRRLMLETELPGADTAPATSLLEAVAATPGGPQIGDVGVAATDLRPAGRGTFGGRLVDVQSGGRYIERGTPIRAIGVGHVIEVEEARS